MKTAAHNAAATGATWRPMLEAVPVRNAAALAERTDDGGWTVSVPTEKPRWLVPPLTFIVRPPSRRSIVLDDMGGWLWEQCDGTRTVEAIIDLFATRHGLSFHESRVAVTGFLKDLIRRGVLAVALGGAA